MDRSIPSQVPYQLEEGGGMGGVTIRGKDVVVKKYTNIEGVRPPHRCAVWAGESQGLTPRGSKSGNRSKVVPFTHSKGVGKGEATTRRVVASVGMWLEGRTIREVQSKKRGTRPAVVGGFLGNNTPATV